MREFGTCVLAGVTPGKGGRTVDGIPVYDSVQAACENHPLDTSVLFVPPAAVRDAAFQALDAGITQLVVLAEHVPVRDAMEVVAEAGHRRARMVGPNCPGIVVPGGWSLGIMPAWAPNIFRPGTVAVVSRSGSLGTLICLGLVQAGLGESAFVGLGGDPILGTTFSDALRLLEEDPATEAVVLVGEVGGTMEEEAAQMVRTMTKPVTAFIAGRSVPEGKRMGHAGAIVNEGAGRAADKIDALRQVGATVAELPSEIGQLVKTALTERPGRGHMRS